MLTTAGVAHMFYSGRCSCGVQCLRSRFAYHLCNDCPSEDMRSQCRLKKEDWNEVVQDKV